MPDTQNLPPLPEIRRALRETTERLAHDLARPLRAAPRWTEFEWDVARAAASVQGIGALLGRRLNWQGPDRWQAFLADQQDHGRQREVLIRSLREQIDDATRRAGLPVVALKGAALLRKDLYSAGERPMGDIDLLVRPEDLGSTSRVLQELGYRHQFTSARHAVFSNAPSTLPRGLGEHIAHPLKIEVHTAIADALPTSPVDITARAWPRNPGPGINEYADDTGLLLHLLLHAAGNMRAHGLRLIQLEDIARFSRRMTDAQWRSLVGAGRRDLAWWALPPLSLARRYCGAVVPDEFLAALRRTTPRALRHAADRYTLTEVSWSNLRISAFPGIEWSRSIGEAWRYAHSRIAPSQRARHELDQAEQAQPMLDLIPWYQLPHHQRMLRWLIGRAPRVQPMIAVLMAVGGERLLQRAGTAAGSSASSR